MEPESKASRWSPHSLLAERPAEYCLMMPVAVGEGRRQLLAAGFQPGPATGSVSFEVWIAPSGFPQMVPYSDAPANQFFDGEELAQALVGR